MLSNSMATLTERLPTELIILICQQLVAESSRSLLSLCLTSKRLYEIAYPIIYSDVRLKSHYGPRSALLRFSSRVERYLNHVHSLDIRFTRGHMSALLTGAPSAFSNLNSTVALLPNLVHLKTFILGLEHHERRNTRLPDSSISSLISRLPPSVSNLEIVTDGLEQISHDERRRILPECFCHSISRLLPQLDHLRLRKGYICPNLFKSLRETTDKISNGQHVEPWPLRSITIRLDMDADWSEEPTSASLCMLREAEPSPPEMAAFLRRGIEVGLLPHLRQAIIISRFGRSSNLCTARKTNHSGFAVHDVVQNSHILVPVLAVETDWNVPVDGGHGSMAMWGDLFLTRDIEGIDHFATFLKLSLALEGGRTFRDLIKKSDALMYSLDFSELSMREQTTLPKNARMSIWLREETIGQCLLSAQHVHGLAMTPNNMAELLPSGWKYGRNNKKGERQVERLVS